MPELKLLKHYFSNRVNREVTEVYWGSILNSLALNLVFIFEPIYLYTLGFSFIGIMWYYVQVYVWYVLLITFGAKFAGRFGYKHSILISNIFYVIYWVVLFSVKIHPSFFYLAPVLFALQKSWYWPAFDADVSIGSMKRQRGRETGVLFSVMQIGLFAGPLLGGFISEKFGFLALFVTAAVVMLSSVFPLFRSPEIYSKHVFRLKNFWAVVRKYPRNFFGYFGYAEDLMVMSLWPVYMFLVIPDFLNIGLVTTIAAVIGTMIMLYVGRLTDRTNKRSLIFNSSIFYGVTWLFRWLVTDLPTALTFHSLTKAGKDITTVPMVTLTFERGGEKNNDWAIAYSVFYEVSLSIGKILTALAAILILATTGNIFLVFALAGILTMFYGLLK